MTLCVAAACHDRGKPRIVIATDWRAEGYLAGADIQDKLYWVGDDIVVLIAGTITKAIELKNTIVQYVEQIQAQKLPGPKAADLCDFFRTPVVQFKRKLVQEHIGLQFGLSYTEFLQAIGLNQIPETIASEAMGEIKRLDQNCCLLLCMFDADGVPRILKVDSDGTLEIVESFAAIGSGSPIAESVLFQREHVEDDVLGASLYHVYEAMKLGSIAPGVGKEFTINVLYPPDREHPHLHGDVLNKRGMAFMEKEFRERGPKPFTNFKRLPNRILDKDFS
jgi:hypothetical protein